MLASIGSSTWIVLRALDGDLRDRLQRRMKEEEDGNFYPQYHGGDATGELAWSIRVDGRFTDAFRALMPAMPANPASRPALWAARR
jgi:hypothetical protein